VKLLLDAMMPEEIGPLLTGHEVVHVAELGWRHLNNGALLSSAEASGFDVLITKDANMPYQQNLTGKNIALLVVRPRTQDLDDLLALAPSILKILPDLTPGSVIRVTQ
jgi:predicted nuclease of predicted toxin-antitoxin system